MKTEESFKNLFDLRDDENIDINLTKADAVKIADIIMKDSTNRHYKVFYDDDNEIYYVVARYTKTRHNWLWVYKERTYITEHVVIDGKNGAVLNVSFKVN